MRKNSNLDGSCDFCFSETAQPGIYPKKAVFNTSVSVPGCCHARWTEEYQAELADEVCRCVYTNPRFSGLTIWMFCDARTYINGALAGRPRGFDNKGFPDEYRRPKLA